MNPRSCVACRTHREPGRMVRVVRGPDGTVSVDRDGSAQGRGAYVCRDERCLVLTCRRHLLDRALRCAVPQSVYDELARLSGLGTEAQMDTKAALLNLFGLARGAGDLIIGQDRLLSALKAGERLAIYVTVDGSEKLIMRLTASGCLTRMGNVTRFELGESLGLRACQVVALPVRSGFARKASDLVGEGGDVGV